MSSERRAPQSYSTTQCLIDFRYCCARAIHAQHTYKDPSAQWMCGNFWCCCCLICGPEPNANTLNRRFTIDSIRPIIVFSLLFNRKFIFKRKIQLSRFLFYCKMRKEHLHFRCDEELLDRLSSALKEKLQYIVCRQYVIR